MMWLHSYNPAITVVDKASSLEAQPPVPANYLPPNFLSPKPQLGEDSGLS